MHAFVQEQGVEKPMQRKKNLFTQHDIKMKCQTNTANIYQNLQFLHHPNWKLQQKIKSIAEQQKRESLLPMLKLLVYLRSRTCPESNIQLLQVMKGNQMRALHREIRNPKLKLKEKRGALWFYISTIPTGQGFFPASLESTFFLGFVFWKSRDIQGLNSIVFSVKPNVILDFNFWRVFLFRARSTYEKFTSRIFSAKNCDQNGVLQNKWTK